ncbi:hypothetical protein WICPIJ_001598 [Wickerhamomyces pijperi]|uniref:Uncharacterized protein n=1 Tax=Wickerhamomyces pijperi TaxID=599730 RepID=A0A9P8TQG1_WICPI|nr:hypothetical protein WICPIJ_001598 [Wickerhamomyces pijperi]
MILPTMTEPSSPAFSMIFLAGLVMAFLMISTPNCWSKLSTLRSFKILEAFNKAVPPPGKIPSSTAALVCSSMTEDLICSILSMMLALEPSPFKMTVSSLVMVMEAQEPNNSGVAFSGFKSNSSLKTVPPVKIAMSPKVFFLLSPKPGALTAQTEI